MADSITPGKVVVVGAGLAGLTAAYTALENGSDVWLLERASKPGGNSIKASSGINGAPTRFQHGKDETLYDDTVKSAGTRLSSSAEDAPLTRVQRENLISTLTSSSRSAIDFLVDEIGVDLSVVSQLGGHSFPRTHRGGGQTPPGAAIVFALLAKLKERPNFKLMTDCEVTRLLPAADAKHEVIGVEFRQDGALKTVEGAVVFTTGGFAGDTWGQLAQNRPDLAGLPSTNDPRPGTHSLLTDVGAVMVDMDSVQIHPTGFVEPSNPDSQVKFLAAEMLRGEGGIMLHRGQRFVNEMNTREHVSNAVMKLPAVHPVPTEVSKNGVEEDKGLTQWDVQILLDPGACEAAGSHIGFYLWKGLLTKKSVKELDPTTRQTIREYCKVVKGAQKDHFGRTVFGAWKLTGTSADDDTEVCIGNVTPVVHFTMGGAVINSKSQILALSDVAGPEPVPVSGLWAAGEITGGIHGDNRLGGSSLLECVVFGRVAGAEVASYLKSRR